MYQKTITHRLELNYQTFLSVLNDVISVQAVGMIGEMIPVKAQMLIEQSDGYVVKSIEATDKLKMILTWSEHQPKEGLDQVGEHVRKTGDWPSSGQTLSGHPLGSEGDNEYHRRTGEQIPKVDLTRPWTFERQVALTLEVLANFANETGPFTHSDAIKVREVVLDMWQHDRRRP